MNSTSEAISTKEDVIIHVLVVGFHHKKGCVVEYSYPALCEGDNVACTDLPDLWKHLPTLALPDGAHNFEEDTIYFHLPSLENPQHTVYGISCYRQMNAQQLLRRSSDITRETVQKSVCVLSRLPFYGLIQAKLELITHAYFDERDFSKVSLLEETYRNLNSSLPKDLLLDGQQALLGLSVRDFVLRFKHKTLLLFKLLLLERRVLFYKAPVKNLCSTILTLCSLVPGLIESGLSESAPEITSHPYLEDAEEITLGNNNKIENCHVEPTDEAESVWYQNNLDVENVKIIEPQLNLNNNIVSASEGYFESGRVNLTITDHTNTEVSIDADSCIRNTKDVDTSENRLSQSSSDTDGESWIKVNQVTPDLGSSATSITSSDTEMKVDNAIHNNEEKLLNEIDEVLNLSEQNHSVSKPSLEFQNISASTPNFFDKNHLFAKGNSLNNLKSAETDSISAESDSINAESDTIKNRRKSESQMENEQHYDHSDTIGPNIIDLDSADCGLPLSIFTKGMLCYPYLSLPFLDILSDVSIRGFLVGATNILFRQKKHLFDVVVEVDDGKVEILDSELRKIVNLTTEDLRFADHLVRHVMDDKKDVFLDGTGWEGGDEWLRSQLKLYLISIMRTSLIDCAGSKEVEAFNAGFMTAWKSTHNYKIWSAGHYPKLLRMNPGHPFHGQLSMADMRLRFSHSMQNTEKGRRINNAVASTGKAVLQTGKVVGKPDHLTRELLQLQVADLDKWYRWIAVVMRNKKCNGTTRSNSTAQEQQGGALSSAKSVVSSWWSTFNVPQPPEKQEDDKKFESEKSKIEDKLQNPSNLKEETILYPLDFEP